MQFQEDELSVKQILADLLAKTAIWSLVTDGVLAK